MRISDWSSDVCSSDLPEIATQISPHPHHSHHCCADCRWWVVLQACHLWAVHAVDRQRLCRGRQRCGFIKSGRIRGRSEEHTSELQSLMRISYAVFCLQKKNQHTKQSRCTTHLSKNDRYNYD